MTNPREQLAVYIDAIADPVRVPEAQAGKGAVSLHRRRLMALAVGLAAVLVPALGVVMFGLVPERLEVADAPAVTTSVVATTRMGGQPAEPSAPGNESAPTVAPTPLPVPNLVGLSQEEAIATLLDAGLQVSTHSVFGEVAPAGTVVDQDPPAGTDVEALAVVEIGISTRATCGVPPLPPAPEGFVEITVLFGCRTDGDGISPNVSYPGHRLVPADQDPLTATIEALVAGPTPAEIEAGYTSFFGLHSANSLLSATVVDGHAVLDFTDRVLVNNSSTSTGMIFFHAELLANTFQFPEIGSVEFRLNGSCVAWANAFESDRCQTTARGEWEAQVASWAD